MIGKRFGIPPLKGPASQGLKVKKLKLKKTKLKKLWVYSIGWKRKFRENNDGIVYNCPSTTERPRGILLLF